MAHSQEEMTLTEPVSEEAHTLDFINEHFKSIVLNLLKELKETVDKNWREQGEWCINKEINYKKRTK